MRRSKSKPKSAPKRVLRLPDLDHAKLSVLNTLGSPESQRAYRFAMDDFIAWYCSEPRIAFNKTVVLRYRIQLEAKHLAPATINLRLAAVRRLAYEAADVGLLSPDLAASIRRVKGAKRLGVRLGNWLSAEQAKDLIWCPSKETVGGKRDHAILAVLLGCGLRRSETARLTVEHFQRRDDHWAIVDLFGKGGHIRSVPVPDWVKRAIDTWTATVQTESGRLFRCVTKFGTVWGARITEKVVWHVVRKYAIRTQLGKIAPHDLRRTCARLCHIAGGELEQIQFLLGHVSVQTTEQYLGCKQRFRSAVNHHIGIEPDED
ncbi:MAG: tyrosine-type recombinase/integrase [Bryobacteraceae bacterium]